MFKLKEKWPYYYVKRIKMSKKKIKNENERKIRMKEEDKE